MFFWLSQQVCRHSCMSMFANRRDRATAVRQTQNTNINTQTDPLTHSKKKKNQNNSVWAKRSLSLPWALAISSVVWVVPDAPLIINRWCQRFGGLSVWQGISINTDFLSISVCSTLLTFNYGCGDVCYLSVGVWGDLRGKQGDLCFHITDLPKYHF